MAEEILSSLSRNYKKKLFLLTVPTIFDITLSLGIITVFFRFKEAMDCDKNQLDFS